MRADTDHHEPGLALLGGAIVVGRRRVLGEIGVARERVGQIVERGLLRLGDFLVGAMANENRLASPHHGDRLSRLDMGNVHVCGGKRQRRGVGTHLVEQRPQRRGGADRREASCRDQNDIAPARLVVVHQRRI
jgi:hypothetical protein